VFVGSIKIRQAVMRDVGDVAAADDADRLEF